MKKPVSKKPKVTQPETFRPTEMEQRIARLQATGKMPPLEAVLAAIQKARKVQP